MEKELRLIVRIANKDLDGNLPIPHALIGLTGISQRTARIMAVRFEEETNTPFNAKLGSVPESMDKKLEEIVLNPEKHEIPGWTLNRQKDLETGKDKHLVMGDLEFGKRQDLQRLSKIKSYRGLRLGWGLTVRGQRTKSTHRGKDSTVGVFKKDTKEKK